ncbi:class I SAM-dependent methyltransferase [Niallia sp. Sow4_A1]|uniref:class I SAM-dependent methyltransferase n=1 Tax=Bacillaceae TaxID=186817 RepID=UPI0004E127AC|nr:MULTISPECIES: class I SAM-dependent methyltransferase [Bacillaceae]MCM3363960.1 class I SAM-dependent methyltransferase [Niallia sp. MER TA 168]
MDKDDVIKKRYNRISGIYDVMDKMIKEEWRFNLLSNVSGKVLEVGIGTGANLYYYPNNIQSLTGVDFSNGMLKYAREKVSKGDFLFPIELVEADIQSLPYPDNTFDSIVSTCVFCSVPDPMIGLKELKRVCKPTGRILMLEHMRSENKLVGLVMDMLNPLTVRLWGANINRETLKTIEQSGLKVEENIPLMKSIMKQIFVRP